jgi:hypothetical protein
LACLELLRRRLLRSGLRVKPSLNSARPAVETSSDFVPACNPEEAASSNACWRVAVSCRHRADRFSLKCPRSRPLRRTLRATIGLKEPVPRTRLPPHLQRCRKPRHHPQQYQAIKMVHPNEGRCLLKRSGFRLQFSQHFTWAGWLTESECRPGILQSLYLPPTPF